MRRRVDAEDLLRRASKSPFPTRRLVLANRALRVASNPGVKSQILAFLGYLYRDQGVLELAEACLEEAFRSRLAQAKWDPAAVDPRTTWGLLWDLVDVVKRRGRVQEADELVNEAAAFLRASADVEPELPCRIDWSGAEARERRQLVVRTLEEGA